MFVKRFLSSVTRDKAFCRYHQHWKQSPRRKDEQPNLRSSHLRCIPNPFLLVSALAVEIDLFAHHRLPPAHAACWHCSSASAKQRQESGRDWEVQCPCCRSRLQWTLCRSKAEEERRPLHHPWGCQWGWRHLAPQLLSWSGLRRLDNSLPVFLLSKPKLVKVSRFLRNGDCISLRFVAPAQEIKEYLVSFAKNFSLYPHIKVVQCTHSKQIYEICLQIQSNDVFIPSSK